MLSWLSTTGWLFLFAGWSMWAPMPFLVFMIGLLVTLRFLLFWHPAVAVMFIYLELTLLYLYTNYSCRLQIRQVCLYNEKGVFFRQDVKRYFVKRDARVHVKGPHWMRLWVVDISNNVGYYLHLEPGKTHPYGEMLYHAFDGKALHYQGRGTPNWTYYLSGILVLGPGARGWSHYGTPNPTPQMLVNHMLGRDASSDPGVEYHLKEAEKLLRGMGHLEAVDPVEEESDEESDEDRSVEVADVAPEKSGTGTEDDEKSSVEESDAPDELSNDHT